MIHEGISTPAFSFPPHNFMCHLRYETALELLGEKTELVEELRANLGENKLMFQEQIDLLNSEMQRLTSALAETTERQKST